MLQSTMMTYRQYPKHMSLSPILLSVRALFNNEDVFKQSQDVLNISVCSTSLYFFLTFES